MQWTDVETARIRFRGMLLLFFSRLNLSSYVHAFALPNGCAPWLSFFVYAWMCRSAVWVCAQSQEVFITACIAKEKWLHTELIRRRMFYMAGMALRRGFNQSWSYMHAQRSQGGSAQRLDSASFMHMHMHRIPKQEWLCAEPLLILYAYMHGLRSQNESCFIRAAITSGHTLRDAY